MNIVNPATGRVIAVVTEDDASTVAAKFQRARAGQRRWAKVPVDDRVAAIVRFRDLVDEHKERLARILTSEVGKPIAQARNEINGVRARIDFFVDHVAQVLKEDVVFVGPPEERIGLEPLGVVANISAWNYPWFVGTNVFVPALLTGNAVLYKPSELATLTGLAIAELLVQAGVPDDVFVPVIGGGAVGSAVLAQAIGGVFFTGSYATGKRIAEAMAGRMVKVQLELGGKDPTYVCEDVDVAGAAASLADGAFYNTGQSCCSVERIYVHESIWAPFVEAFLREVDAFVAGDPTDDKTYIGALTREAQIAVLDAQVKDAVAKGAKLLRGGRRLERPGNFYAPTVLVDVDGSMAVQREESFGPIIGLQRVSGDDHAVREMNDTTYGLTAGVYTRDGDRARRILADVDAGTAYWNCCDRVSPRLPWTGRGHSGIGSTLSIEGIRTFLRPKAWHLKPPSS